MRAIDEKLIINELGPYVHSSNLTQHIPKIAMLTLAVSAHTAIKTSTHTHIMLVYITFDPAHS